MSPTDSFFILIDTAHKIEVKDSGINHKESVLIFGSSLTLHLGHLLIAASKRKERTAIRLKMTKTMVSFHDILSWFHWRPIKERKEYAPEKKPRFIMKETL
jgi:hypothetical protein